MPIELTTISSGYNISAINDNFQTIEDAWDEKIDRLVSSQGNAMSQDLDLDGNDILNAYVSGRQLEMVVEDAVSATDSALLAAEQATSAAANAEDASGNVAAAERQVTGLVIYPAASSLSADTTNNNYAITGTTALRDAETDTIYITSEVVSGTITELDFDGGTATVGGTSVTLTARRGTVQVNSVEELTALTQRTGAVYLANGTESRYFIWDDSDLSSQVAIDTIQAVYIAPNSDATGASGAWVMALYNNTIPTSLAGIESSTSTDYRHEDLQVLMDLGLSVVVDTEIYLNSTVTVSTKNALISGALGGSLKAGTDMSESYLLEVTADNVMIQELELDNPSEVKSQTGGRQGGIIIKGDNCTVARCRFYRMLQGISADASSETAGHKILFNRFMEMLGAGDGIDNLTSSYGEDRGDAVTMWAEHCLIQGNSAQLKDGEDGRIAFHCESFSGQAEGHQMIDNMAIGAYRRHFAFENVIRGVMANNISRGGATWWAHAVIQGEEIDIINPITRWTRTSADNQGASWAPIRGVFGILNHSTNVSIKGGKTVMTDDSEGYLLSTAPTIDEHLDVVISNHNARNLNTTTRNRGLDITGLTDPIISDNILRGFNQAIKSYRNPTGFTAAGNRIIDATIGIQAEYSDAATINIKNNEFKTISDDAVNITGASNTLVLKDNTAESVTNQDYDFFSFASLYFSGNSNNDATGTLRLYGTTSGVINSDDQFLLGLSKGYPLNWQFPSASLTDATSALNIYDKYAGRTVAASNELYMAQGPNATSNWLKLSDGTTITPS